MSDCRCGEPDCVWLAVWDYAEQQLANDLREQRGREVFGYEEPIAGPYTEQETTK